MRSRDPAEIETDKIIAEIERRITTEYRQAEREIKERLDDYLKRFQKKDDTWRRWVSDGKRSAAEYQQWRTGQIAIGQRWEDMRATLARDLMNAENIARSIARGYMPEVYAINHNYGTFECEKGSGIDTSYTLYSREAVERMMRDNPQMLPAPGRKVSQEIAEGRAERWNNNHIQSVMMQGILQGNTISDLATRLANTVGDSSRKAAIRNARTMATATQNAGRQDAYKRAKSKGIETQKQWMATLDMRTRHDHRAADLQTVEVEEPFIVGGYEMMYPGDYSAPGSQVYNCRCTTRAVLAGITSGSLYNADGSDARDTSGLEGMTYDEWQKSRVERPENILRPDRRADDARARYIREYAENPRLDVPSGRRTDLSIDALSDNTNMADSSKDKPREMIELNAPTSLEDSMKPSVMDKYARQVRKAPEEIQNMHDLFDGDAKFVRVKDYGSHYDPIKGIVYYTDKIPEGHNRFQVLNHELGHLYDHRIDGSLKDLTFGEFDKVKKATGLDKADGWGVNRPSNSDKFLKAMRADIDRLSNLVFDDVNWPSVQNVLNGNNATRGMQDFIDGAFGDITNTGLKWGHGNKYYDRAYQFMSEAMRNNAVAQLEDDDDIPVYDSDSLRRILRDYETASELWGHINAAQTVRGDALDYTLRIAPESTRAFMEIAGMLKL